MPHTKEELSLKFDEWEGYLANLCLPAWDELPTLELYMDQVVIVLNEYLGIYSAGDDDKAVTQAMVNNYVKQKLIPPPVKKKYGRVHLSLLMMICTLKQTLSIPHVKSMLPGWEEDEVRRFYTRFISVQKGFGSYFATQVRTIAQPIFDENGTADDEITDFMIRSSVASCYSKLLTEEMIAYKNEE